MRILIADDHEVVRHGLRAILSREFTAADIGEAKDSREAVRMLMQGTWDLLLLDINMPGRSGLEILRDARHLCPQARVLVLSAS